ncbi:GNAT family N-acetyltransferase [Flavobacteriaceae bacterium]|jgi:GNAT superfamily N-acetyltransferase|nr:GNAT family N-acetyltransferase [Flavobacteriaceae bacterium]MCP4802300.1 GNAT family N-acetyltransferase [Bacteroidota bacterium]MDA9551705.1 GNAT family N-acetyltransferase [Flavobacteriaceae bacterium]MDC0956764.1 GNAT family N-acetyltransferase [Flavobacteriaceae bacterium]MDC3269521.1 GNAT family N-acetyltransferase [Flavobacteriaceae bacterium]
MNFKIRNASSKDMSAVLQLIVELAVFEKEPNAVEITEQSLIEDGFQGTPAFKCFVATVDDKVVGTALIYHRFSTWKGKILHLEDLIVTQKMRGHGIGTALLDEVVKYGYHLKVKRINWEVISWNNGAIKLYERQGAKVLRNWNVVHLDEKGIETYITKLN